MDTPRNLPAADNTKKAKSKSLHWINRVERDSNVPVGGMPIDAYLELPNNKGLADALIANEELADKLFGSELYRAYYTKSGHTSKKSTVDWKSLV